MTDPAVLLLTVDEAAALLRKNPGTLRNWRSLGRGPSWVRNPDTGDFMGYRPEDIEAWLDAGSETAS